MAAKGANARLHPQAGPSLACPVPAWTRSTPPAEGASSTANPPCLVSILWMVRGQ